jgi:hypothetical protein
MGIGPAPGMGPYQAPIPPPGRNRAFVVVYKHVFAKPQATQARIDHEI